MQKALCNNCHFVTDHKTDAQYGLQMGTHSTAIVFCNKSRDAFHLEFRLGKLCFDFTRKGRNAKLYPAITTNRNDRRRNGSGKQASDWGCQLARIVEEPGWILFNGTAETAGSAAARRGRLRLAGDGEPYL